MDINFFILLAPVLFMPSLAIVGAVDIFRALVYVFSFTVSCILLLCFDDMLLSVLSALLIIAVLTTVRKTVMRKHGKIKPSQFVVVNVGEEVTFFDGKGINFMKAHNVSDFQIGDVVSISADSFD